MTKKSNRVVDGIKAVEEIFLQLFDSLDRVTPRAFWFLLGVLGAYEIIHKALG
jgi:hypothetical protein